MNPEWIDPALIVYPLLGVAAGLIAGMLGVGGGLVIVPVLIAVFSWQQFDGTHLVHLAIGSSLATIVITGAASTLAHHRHRAVDWDLVRVLAPGLMVGAMMGALLAAQLETVWLRRVFGVFEMVVAAYMLLAVRVAAHGELPGKLVQSISGGVIGIVSGLVGIGGGTMTVPWMVWFGSDMRRAVATSAACGIPIAVAGTLGFAWTGSTANIDHSSGYIYWPAVLGIGLVSIMTAGWGARLAHLLPMHWLKRIFALLLLMVGLRLVV